MTGHTKSLERQRRYQRGQKAEAIAAWLLRAKLYRILNVRFSSPVGEIDLIARRAGRLAFVEVKHRPTIEGAFEAVSLHNQERVVDASHIWLNLHPSMAQLEIGYDIVTVVPRRWPRHFPDSFDCI